MISSLPLTASPELKKSHYEDVLSRIDALLSQENDWVSAMATVACELHHGFDYFDWTGFYRTVSQDLLKVGPYQGGHGCLMIPFSKGVCGAAARSGETQMIADVNRIADHIACSFTTQSEIVVPIKNSEGMVQAVFDVDSNTLGAFDELDKQYLEKLCQDLGQKFFP